MKIAIATDHAGYILKEELLSFLGDLGHEVHDFGAHKLDPDDDYTDFIIPASKAVAGGEVDRAIVLGSSGVGEAIAANRIKGARAFGYYGHAKTQDNTFKKGELKGLIHESREDNDTNILSLGASFVSPEEAKSVIQEWLDTEYTGEERHARRIKKLDA